MSNEISVFTKTYQRDIDLHRDLYVHQELPKRPTKETCKRDQQKKPRRDLCIHEELPKRPDILKGPIKETQKRPVYSQRHTKET